MKQKKIGLKSIQSRSPFTLTLLLVLVCDYYTVSDIVKGIIYTLLGLIWLAWLYELTKTEWVNPFEDKPYETQEIKMPRGGKL